MIFGVGGSDLWGWRIWSFFWKDLMKIPDQSLQAKNLGTPRFDSEAQICFRKSSRTFTRVNRANGSLTESRQTNSPTSSSHLIHRTPEIDEASITGRKRAYNTPRYSLHSTSPPRGEVENATCSAFQLSSLDHLRPRPWNGLQKTLPDLTQATTRWRHRVRDVIWPPGPENSAQSVPIPGASGSCLDSASHDSRSVVCHPEKDISSLLLSSLLTSYTPTY